MTELSPPQIDVLKLGLGQLHLRGLRRLLKGIKRRDKKLLLGGSDIYRDGKYWPMAFALPVWERHEIAINNRKIIKLSEAMKRENPEVIDINVMPRLGRYSYVDSLYLTTYENLLPIVKALIKERTST